MRGLANLSNHSIEQYLYVNNSDKAIDKILDFLYRNILITNRL